MDDGLVAAEHPLISVAALDPHAGLIRRYDLGSAKGGDCAIALERKSALRPAEHVHQAALADGEPEEVGKNALKPLVRQGLEGLEIGRHRMKPRSERRTLSHIRHGRGNEHAAGRAGHRRTPVPLDHGFNLRQFNRHMFADDRSCKIAR